MKLQLDLHHSGSRSLQISLIQTRLHYRYNSLSLGRTSLKHSYLYPHGLYLTETIPEPLVTISVYINGTVQKNIFKRMQN